MRDLNLVEKMESQKADTKALLMAVMLVKTMDALLVSYSAE